jgi:hypothetical protein
VLFRVYVSYYYLYYLLLDDLALLVFIISNMERLLHIFFLDPVTVLLEDLGQLWICPLEEDH